jgi:hypothetical protein
MQLVDQVVLAACTSWLVREEVLPGFGLQGTHRRYDVVADDRRVAPDRLLERLTSFTLQRFRSPNR